MAKTITFSKQELQTVTIEITWGLDGGGNRAPLSATIGGAGKFLTADGTVTHRGSAGTTFASLTLAQKNIIQQVVSAVSRMLSAGINEDINTTLPT